MSNFANLNNVAVPTILPTNNEALDVLKNEVLTGFKEDPYRVGMFLGRDRFAEMLERSNIYVKPQHIEPYSKVQKNVIKNVPSITFAEDNDKIIRYRLSTIQKAFAHTYFPIQGSNQMAVPYVSKDNEEKPFIRELYISNKQYNQLSAVMRQYGIEHNQHIKDFSKDPYEEFEKAELTNPLLFYMALEDSYIKVEKQQSLNQLGSISNTVINNNPNDRDSVTLYFNGDPRETQTFFNYGLDEMRNALKYALLQPDGTYKLPYISQIHKRNTQNPDTNLKARILIVTENQLNTLKSQLLYDQNNGNSVATIGDVYGNFDI